MSNSKEPHISLRVKEYSSNQSYLINFLYLLHLDIYLKSMYPWMRITRVQKNEVFCIINISCKFMRISLLLWLHIYSILIHDACHKWTRWYWPLRITWLRSLFFFVQVCEDNSLWYLFDSKLPLLFFYASLFHILMNIFTFPHYRQNEQLYLSLLTAIIWNDKNKIILEGHSIYFSFRKSNI
jgi:hypothetical protein